MRDFRKKICLLTAACLFLSAVLTGCSDLFEKKQSYYEAEVLSDLTRMEEGAEKLSGMTEGLCVIEDESVFNEKLIAAGAAGLFCEDTKEVIYAKNATKRMYPASITKCMTALLVLESGLSLADEILIGDEVTGFTDSSSLAGLRKGFKYTVEELLTALMVPSGNDAANALAVAVSGSVDAFVDRMNERAFELGMVNTHFESPHGLHSKKHYTTVYDLYLLFRVCINNRDFLRIASTPEASISGTAPSGAVDILTFSSTNSYLKNYTVPPNGLTVRAAKTGYTRNAGRCLILCTTDKEGKRYISIILNADTYDELYLQMNTLLSLTGQ